MPVDEILNEAQTFSTLEEVLKWAFARRPPAELQSVITQDEYTHDVVIRLTARLFLNFDTT